MEFLARRGSAGVTEVANEIGIHKSTAYRLLTTLRDRGLVEQDAATEKYGLGFGLVLLASTVTADLDVLRCARPLCERLSEQTDRKSTRLNSSHANISYAVFCLKKKNKQIYPHIYS